MICYLFPKPIYFLFSSDVPTLLYYAYIPTTIVALLIGFYVLWNNKHSLLNQLLFLISILFSFWTMSALIEWTNIYSDCVLFIWNFQGLIFGLIAIFSIYFIDVFLNKKDVSVKSKIAFLALLAPIFISTPTFYLKGFDITNCDAFEFSWRMLEIYYTLLGALAMIWILALLIRKYRTAEVEFKKQILLMGFGMELFLFLFFIWTNAIYYLTGVGILSDSRLEMYGMLGIIIFIGLLAYMIVRYKAFNIKLLGAQALVIGIFILIASQFSFIQNNTNRILTTITLVMVTIFGWWLVKAVKKVDEQKEQLEVSNQQLEVANVALEKADQAKNEFINIASHQLRTPVTVLKGTISMLQDGTMDEFDAEHKKKFYDSAQFKCQKLEEIINSILSATSLTNKKLDVTGENVEKINVEEFFEKMINGFKVSTLERDIDLHIGSLDPTVTEIFGQKMYLEEAFSNLITNAIKYTPSPKQTPDIRDIREGAATIVIGSRKVGDNVIFSVKDNGIGIPPEAMSGLFKKFARAKNAVDMYTDGTGLGLFIIKEIVEGHGGKVWVESELGKGSEFFVQLPITPIGKVDMKEYIRDRAEMKM